MENCACRTLKARLHRRFLSQQLDAIFVALKVKVGVIHLHIGLSSFARIPGRQTR